jgi:hypothetical protein
MVVVVMAIFAAITALTPLIGKVFDKVFPDPAAADAAKLKFMELQQQGDLAELDADVKLAAGQLDINKQEARHSSIFVAGWRPFVGWTCGMALAYHFILQPFIMFAIHVAGVEVGEIPTLDMADLYTVLLGMLGLGGMRSYEKRNGVAQQMLKAQNG